jgi:hypothetical protein
MLAARPGGLDGRRVGSGPACERRAHTFPDMASGHKARAGKGKRAAHAAHARQGHKLEKAKESRERAAPFWRTTRRRAPPCVATAPHALSASCFTTLLAPLLVALSGSSTRRHLSPDPSASGQPIPLHPLALPQSSSASRRIIAQLPSTRLGDIS